MEVERDDSTVEQDDVALFAPILTDLEPPERLAQAPATTRGTDWSLPPVRDQQPKLLPTLKICVCSPNVSPLQLRLLADKLLRHAAWVAIDRLRPDLTHIATNLTDVREFRSWLSGKARESNMDFVALLERVSVVTVGWVCDCLAAGHLVAEDMYKPF